MRKYLLLLLCLALPGILIAQTTTPSTLNHDGFVALYYYDPQGTPRSNGEFGYYVQIPNAAPGTYVYSSFGFYGTGKGVIAGVPETGVLQHVADFTSKVHLTANLGVGPSFVSNGNGTAVGPSFAGGGNISQDIGRGFSVVYSVKIVNHICSDPKTNQTSNCNTLVGGVGITWGH